MFTFTRQIISGCDKELSELVMELSTYHLQIATETGNLEASLFYELVLTGEIFQFISILYPTNLILFIPEISHVMRVSIINGKIFHALTSVAS